MIGSHAALGYIVMGLLAFLLGVCVTVLLYRLRRRNERRSREEKEDEKSDSICGDDDDAFVGDAAGVCGERVCV